MAVSGADITEAVLRALQADRRTYACRATGRVGHDAEDVLQTMALRFHWERVVFGGTSDEIGGYIRGALERMFRNVLCEFLRRLYRRRRITEAVAKELGGAISRGSHEPAAQEVDHVGG